MWKFMEATWLMPSDKDFYVQLEWYMEAQFLKEEMEKEDETDNKTDSKTDSEDVSETVSEPISNKPKTDDKQEKDWVYLYEMNEQAYVLLHKSWDIQWVVVGDRFFVATKKQITHEYLFELVEQWIITAKQAKELLGK